MQGHASLLREKGGSSVVAGVPQVYETHIPPREAGCFDLGGCSISEVNKPCNGETGSVFFHFYF